MPAKKKITKKARATAKVLPNLKKKRKKGAGRPKARIREYFEKILPFLQRGLSVKKSCEHAGVPQQTVNDYMNRDGKFSVEVKVAQRTTELLARQNITNSIKRGGIDSAKWYLERKCKDEFSLRVEGLNENHESDVTLIKLPRNGREGK